MFITHSELDISIYDVIVAGSGPAGAVTAKKAAEAGKTVLVIETGDRERDGALQDRYSRVHGRGHFRSDYWPRHWVRALGGTSAVWNGWMAPLSARNMRDWPISREALDPWYDFAAVELGRPTLINRWKVPSFAGFNMQPFSEDSPSRYGGKVGAPIWADDRVHVLLNTSVSRLVPRQDRRGIAGLRLFAEPDWTVDLALAPRQNLVLAGGGMGNPQMLFASDDGTGRAVGNENDQLGRYLMEHPHAFNCAYLFLKDSVPVQEPPPAFGSFKLALVPTDEAFDATGPLDVSIGLRDGAPDEEDAIERFVRDRLGGGVRVFRIEVRSEMLADPANRVEPLVQRDPAGLPRLRATCVLNADDQRIILHYLTQLGNVVANADLGRLKIQNDVVFYDYTGGGHIMGTTRMGADPKTSVTDANCRVHGYENLFVAGSSLFTTGGYANPTMTIVALAARLGDYLGQQG